MISGCISPDYYIKASFHRNAYLYKGRVFPPAVASSELWLSNDKAALVSKNRILILDKKKKTIYFINTMHEIYFEAKLPFEATKILDMEALENLKKLKFEITVKPTSKVKTIKGLECKGYTMNSVTLREQAIVEKVNANIWATSKVPFNMELFNELFLCQMQLMLPGKEYIDNLKKIKGIRIQTEMEQLSDSKGLISKQEITEITNKKAPKDIYKVPRGYKKVDKMSLIDLGLLLMD